MPQPPKENTTNTSKNEGDSPGKATDESQEQDDPFAEFDGTLHDPDFDESNSSNKHSSDSRTTGDSGSSKEPLTEIGSYVILSEVGAGGMGMVYKGQHKLDRIAEIEGPVAIKMIAPELAQSAQFRARFEQEAAIGMHITHPNIAKVLNVHVGERLACIMAYVDGSDLSEVIAKGEMKQEEIVELLQLLSEAIDHFHGQGILHRDLKPQNIKIRSDGAPVILDFGIAKAESKGEDGLTQTGQSMGTPKYMAPEQMDAKHVDERTDQYSLALIAYELLAGQLPWEKGLSAFQIYGKKQFGGLTPLEEHGVSNQISAAVMKGLSAAPDERYGSCKELVDAIKAKSSDLQKSDGVNEQEHKGAQAPLEDKPLEDNQSPTLVNQTGEDKNEQIAGFKDVFVLAQIGFLVFALGAMVWMTLRHYGAFMENQYVLLKMTCFPTVFFVLAHLIVRRIKGTSEFWAGMLALLVGFVAATHLFLEYLNPRYKLFDTLPHQRNIVVAVYVVAFSVGLFADKLQSWRGSTLALAARYWLLLSLVHFLLLLINPR